MGPEEKDMKKVDPQVLMRQDEVAQEGTRARTFATVLEDSWLLTVLLVLMGVVYEWHTIAAKGFHLDINGFIFIVLMLGLLFHWRPIRYVRAFESGARTVGPILRSEEHTSELQSPDHLVCRLLLEKKNMQMTQRYLIHRIFTLIGCT